MFTAFMVATQFFYTLSLIAMLIAILFVTMYLLCIDDYYKISVLKWTGIDLITAGEQAVIESLKTSSINFSFSTSFYGSFFVPRSHSECRGFESWHRILDGHFFTYFCCKKL